MEDVTVTPPAEDRFERIGTTYYKIVRQPNAAGQLIERSIPWTIEAIRQDYGKDFLANVPKYDGFCCVPSHLDYQPVVGSFKNKYSPLTRLCATPVTGILLPFCWHGRISTSFRNIVVALRTCRAYRFRWATTR